jgi:hypothetical protein
VNCVGFGRMISPAFSVGSLRHFVTSRDVRINKHKTFLKICVYNLCIGERIAKQTPCLLVLRLLVMIHTIVSSRLVRVYLLLACLSFFTSTAKQDHQDRIIGGYLPDYRFYIDLNQTVLNLTDLYLFSVQPTGSNNQLDACCLGAHHYEQIHQARAYKKQHAARDLNIWLTIGGAGRSDHFLDNLDGLVNDIRTVSRKHNLTGVVLDCEMFRNQQEYANYQNWIMKAAKALRRDGIKISVTLHVGQFLLMDLYSHIDQVHLMAYDMQGDSHANLQAAKVAVHQLLRQGCPSHKIILGIPAYARHMRNPGQVMTFSEIIDDMSGATTTSDWSSAGRWKGYRGDSVNEVQQKVQWANDNSLGGVFFWELGQDKQHATAPGGILLAAANSEASFYRHNDEL